MLEAKENFFKKPENRKSFFIRLISSVVMVGLLVIYIALGRYHSYHMNTSLGETAGYVNLVITLILFVICAYEITKTFNVKGYLQVMLIFFLTVLAYFPLNFDTSLDYPFFEKMSSTWLVKWGNHNISLFYTLVWVLIFLVNLFIGFKVVKHFNKAQDGTRYFGLYLFYAMVIVFGFKTLFSLLLSSANVYNGTLTLVWIWIMIISADTFAYLGGILFGKHKLTSISPKKTVEGAIIGFSFSFIIGVAIAISLFYGTSDWHMFGDMLKNASKTSICILLVLFCLITPIISMFGDIAFSYVKRVVDIKDFSNVIPGHGGALDRLDSLIFTLFIFYWIMLFGNPGI
ncbi:phosphatidate cytidylyltransferase [Spiroplasma endosymbiont of Crioceris asparagi]|uniref:phosphatidate cytidylyltransferase n=1 Tax=Spiroplasma endosymbiont of Crioceris asparagi TaxID=3066286 RepID=UPI0030D0F726